MEFQLRTSNPKRWCCESTALTRPANLANSVVATGLENVSLHCNPKECSNYWTIALISHASKIRLKILLARLQQFMNCELPDVQTGFWKGRGIRDQISNIHWIIEKARVSEIHLFLLYWLCQSIWLCGSQKTVEKFSRDGNTRPPELPSEKSVCRSRSNS